MGKVFKESGYLVCIIVSIILTITISIIKYRDGNINYYNSDATWHTLLTIEAYNETPISQHLFLPIVSLGDSSDKWISWGATVPDASGNYYYTSFSPAGYFIPWIFMKLFKLQANELSLYIFNTVLFAMSAVLWGIFLKWIYHNTMISLFGVACYICVPELLHGMGIAYWHQSLYQVFFIAQVMAYYCYKTSASTKAKIVFYFFALINPYVEWTGYVANAGFCLVELLLVRKNERRTGIKRTIVIAFLTIMSMSCFVLHYLLRIDKNLFFAALKSRFFARNVTTDVELSSVIGGYFKSFGFIWILLLGLIIVNICMFKSIKVSHGIIMVLLLFPLLENVVMKQHALQYSYDRMKGIIFLSFLCCELMSNIYEELYGNKGKAILFVFVVICCFLNLNSYIHDKSYIWNAEYRATNEIIADYINENYSDSIMGVENDNVRGYTNLLFQRGVYEFCDIETLITNAIEKKKKYAVLLQVEDSHEWNMTEFGGAEIYNVESGDIIKFSISNGTIIQE